MQNHRLGARKCQKDEVSSTHTHSVTCATPARVRLRTNCVICCDGHTRDRSGVVTGGGILRAVCAGALLSAWRCLRIVRVLTCTARATLKARLHNLLGSSTRRGAAPLPLWCNESTFSREEHDGITQVHVSTHPPRLLPKPRGPSCTAAFLTNKRDACW